MPVASEAGSGEVERGRPSSSTNWANETGRATRPETSSDLGAQGGGRNPPLNISTETPTAENAAGRSRRSSTDATPPAIEDAGSVKTMLSFESLLKLDQ